MRKSTRSLTRRKFHTDTSILQPFQPTQKADLLGSAIQNGSVNAHKSTCATHPKAKRVKKKKKENFSPFSHLNRSTKGHEAKPTDRPKKQARDQAESSKKKKEPPAPRNQSGTRIDESMDRCTAEQGGGWGDLTLTGVAKERADPAREEAMAGGSTKVEGGEHEARDSDWEEERGWPARRGRGVFIQLATPPHRMYRRWGPRGGQLSGAGRPRGWPFCFRPEVLVG